MARNATVLVAAEDLQAVAARILERHGFSIHDAAEIADVLCWADLRGHGSHGVSRLPRYLGFVKSKALNPQATPKQVAAVGAIVLIKGGRCAGPLAMNLATRLVTETAERHGMGLAIVTETTHAGAIGYFAEKIARKGMIGIAFAAGTPLAAYVGASGPSVSTSPLAIAAPLGGDDCFLLDMATSVAALGKIREAAAAGKTIPEGWALDAQGESATDPSKATTLLPLGGAKGAGLALAFELIASLAGGAPILTEAGAENSPHRQNAAIIAINIQALGEFSAFERDAQKLAAHIRSLPRAPGVDRIFLPGERGADCARKARESGVSLRTDLWEQLCALANPPSG